MRRVGVFGGCFDPPHIAHMIHAMLVRELFDLERLIFVPSADPPHKTLHATFEDRAQMLLLALEERAGFEVSFIEKEEGLSYTVDTLTHLKRKMGDSKLHLIVGRDEYDALETWRDPGGIMELADLIVLPRNGAVRNEARERVHYPELPLINISSSLIRERIEKGKSIHYLLPLKVEEYILEKNIYQEESCQICGKR